MGHQLQVSRKRHKHAKGLPNTRGALVRIVVTPEVVMTTRIPGGGTYCCGMFCDQNPCDKRQGNPIGVIVIEHHAKGHNHSHVRP